ncbi:uncharacterized protein LOC121835115 [Ixodes scapularis]|uniref:uncharacterized protein LOC121835115 n=1 Tax=Ixodes scapularis TaxID=6945 RepID=UPI001C380840|nr:uncharacterized protein LOC121835115 [Ixodes scapularis]
MGNVPGEAWYITAKVNNQDITFKVNTGADVTAIPPNMCDATTFATLQTTGTDLYGAGHTPLNTLGRFTATVTWNGRTTREIIYVSDQLKHPLLGRPAIEALQVLPSLNEVKAESKPEYDHLRKKYPLLFQGLGKMNVEYKIALHPDARSFAITYPRRVPLPLLPSTQQELQRMQDMDVIERVDHARAWCAPMVVA